MSKLTGKWKIVSLFTAHVRTDGGTQSRVEINNNVVEEYADAMADDVTFPPAVVFNDGSNNWLADGFHRFYGAEKAKRRLVCEVRPGTRRDAVLFSVGANATHGLRRSNADKKKAVETLLEDPEWNQWSNGVIAAKCGVSDRFVGLLRKVSTPNGSELTATKGADGKVRDTSNIGAKRTLFQSGSKPDESEDGHPKEGATSEQSAEVADQPSNEEVADSEPDSSSETSSEPESAGADQSSDVATNSVAESATASQETSESQTSLAPLDEKKEPTIEEIVNALPLAKALSLYGHNGHIFRQDAIFCLEHKESIGKLSRRMQGDLRHKKGHRIDIWKQAIQNNDPAQWEGCPACKGSLRFGERRDPCHSCNATGYTTRKDEGVSADVVASYAHEFNS